MRSRIAGIIGGGAPAYDPGMMTYDGSTGYYYDSTVTDTTNFVSAVVRFNNTGSAGAKCLLRARASDNLYYKLNIYIQGTDHPTAPGNIQVISQNTSNVAMLLLKSSSRFDDGADHTLFVSYDATAGTAILYVDGVDEDDTGYGSRVLTTGTAHSFTGLYVGRSNTTSQYWDGDIGFVGLASAYLTNPLDFMDGAAPKQLDETTWTEFGSQPVVFADDGKLDTNNLGSSGAFTKFGTITGPA